MTSDPYIPAHEITEAICNIGSFHALVVDRKEIAPPPITRTEIVDNLRGYPLEG